MSVEEDRGGWAAIIRFAKDREELNRSEARRGKAKKKGLKELNKLGFSINYDNKTKDREGDKVSSEVGGGRSQRDHLCQE